MLPDKSRTIISERKKNFGLGAKAMRTLLSEYGLAMRK
jgi:hypothetical protein